MREDTGPVGFSYRDTFKTVGAIRGAAFDLALALRGTAYADLAAELHDSLCKALPQPMDTPVSVLAVQRKQLIERANWLRSEYINGGNYEHLKAREDECRYIAKLLLPAVDD